MEAVALVVETALELMWAEVAAVEAKDAKTEDVKTTEINDKNNISCCY